MEVRITPGTVDAVPSPTNRGRGTPMNVLVVSHNEQAHSGVRSILADAGWNLLSATGTETAVRMLDDHEFAVVLCDRDVSPRAWIHLLTRPVARGCPPRMIVFSRLADDLLWAEVLNLGGYDLLLFPFEIDELTRVTRAACENWQREARTLTAAPPEMRKVAGREESRSPRWFVAGGQGR